MNVSAVTRALQATRTRPRASGADPLRVAVNRILRQQPPEISLDYAQPGADQVRGDEITKAETLS